MVFPNLIYKRVKVVGVQRLAFPNFPTNCGYFPVFIDKR